MSTHAETDRLLEVGGELIRQVNRTTSRYRVLCRQWQPETAAAARDELCGVLEAVAYDGEFWQALKTVAQPPESWEYFLAELGALPLHEFEDSERALLEWAGADPILAAEWASSTALVLRVIREGVEYGVPLARWVEADREREFVRLAAEAVCGARPPAVDAPEDEAPAPRSAKRFRQRLWGGIRVGGGIAQIAFNAVVLAGGAPIPGINIATTVLGGGSILGGVWTTVAGGESLHESLAED
jgi:hypothetical protein